MHNPQILFEDDTIIVISKPAGMTVNNADSVKDTLTVQNWADIYLHISDRKAEFKKESIVVNGYDIVEEFLQRGGIVHRLDKETSGVLVIAKNPTAFAYLKDQFMGRSTKKVYLALAHGDIEPKEGIIDAPTDRLPYNRTHFGVVLGGREAVTQYKVLQTFEFINNKQKEALTLVELEPKTGRTHQIRVHLKHIGHPIFADELYAGRKTARDDRKLLPRLFLHAKSLTFTNPHGNIQTVEAPLPEELENFVKSLQPQN